MGLQFVTFQKIFKTFSTKTLGSPFNIDLLEVGRSLYNKTGYTTVPEGGGERGLSSFPVDTEEINGYYPRQSYFSV